MPMPSWKVSFMFYCEAVALRMRDATRYFQSRELQIAESYIIQRATYYREARCIQSREALITVSRDALASSASCHR